MIKPGYVSETTFLANKMPPVLPCGHILRRENIGRSRPAHLVGVTSGWNDLFATPVVHRDLLSSSRRDIWIRIRTHPDPPLTGTYCIVPCGISIQGSRPARDDVQPSLALGLGPCRICSRVSSAHLSNRKGTECPRTGNIRRGTLRTLFCTSKPSFRVRSDRMDL